MRRARLGFPGSPLRNAIGAQAPAEDGGEEEAVR